MTPLIDLFVTLLVVEKIDEDLKKRFANRPVKASPRAITPKPAPATRAEKESMLVTLCGLGFLLGLGLIILGQLLG